jgi:hypothetical protein
MPTPQIFQYTSPTVTVGSFTFDASTLNAYIKRAWSAFDKEGVKYELASKAYGDPSRELSPDGELAVDCSGYVWWATYRKRLGSLWDKNPNEGWQKNWVEIDRPIPGAAVRYSAKPGRKYGHVGFVVAVNGDNFETLDSSDSKSPPRKGAIRWTTDGHSRWVKNGGPQLKFVVSREALVAINGQPHKPKLNVYLAAAKHPIAAAAAAGSALLLVAAALGLFVVRRRRALA